MFAYLNDWDTVGAIMVASIFAPFLFACWQEFLPDKDAYPYRHPLTDDRVIPFRAAPRKIGIIPAE
ncbi:MAG: hypothetical protein RLZZ416_36 [Candidatus Parcubacteria bacterium]|jgi:hypothetical protein